MPHAHSSNDPALDRRFAWAEASAAEGDHAAAEEILCQIVAERPDWAAAWFHLGEARLAQQNSAAAAEAFRQAITHDQSDELGAVVALAASGLDFEAVSVPDMSPTFVTLLFDQYAIRFDAHLSGALAYRGPELLRAAILRACAARGRAARFARGVDLGCGTGLFGAAMAAEVEAMRGVDLSPRMIDVARTKNVYAQLAVGDIVAFLAAEPAASADLIAAADVFAYVGNLAPAFAQAARALASDGLFAFTTQARDGEGFAIGPDRRFAHSRAYLEGALAEAGLDAVEFGEAATRLDRGAPVVGHVVVAGLSRSGAQLDSPPLQD